MLKGGLYMGDIFDIFDHFWGIANNKAISIDIITILLLGLAYWNFKIIRHPRYRFRIAFISIIVLLNVNLYLFQIFDFKIWHICYFVVELLGVVYIIMSAYTPIITFFPMKKLKKLVRGGFRKECDSYFHIMKLVTLTTASKLEYKRLLTDDYANRYLYINAYKEFYCMNQKRLFDSEKDETEIYMAYYAALLGSIKLAKAHISKVKEKSPLSLLVEMKISDIQGGDIQDVIKYIEEAETIMNSQTPNRITAQIYAIYSNCRMIQGNYEDALFNVKKALDFAKKSNNNIVIYNTYEQLITLMCFNNPNADDISAYYKEYLEYLDLSEPSTAIRAYNFMSKYYRLQNQKDKLLPLVANNYTALIKTLEGCERYNWEVSNLDVAQHAGIHIKNIMHDVINDYHNFKSVNMPDRFYLIKKLYGILDHFFAIASKEVQYEEYRRIYRDCELYIAEKAYEDLKRYYDMLDLSQIYERCGILDSMVAVSAMREWHNKICIIRYDKLIGNAYFYENLEVVANESEHKERVKILEDIADIYSSNELYPQSIEFYIRIAEECYSVYWLEDESKYEISVIDKVNMEKYIEVAIRKIKENDNSKRFQPQYIKIAAQLCVLSRFDEAATLYNLFDKKELKNFNMHTLNYFRFAESILKSFK